MNQIERLLVIMAQLRDPELGCPWDKQQTFSSILPYTLEEVYEVAEAIDHNDMTALREELGDLLFQIVFYAQMANEQNAFDFEAIAAGIADKLIQRHPHVFGETEIGSAESQTKAWEHYKEQERTAKAESEDRLPSALDNIPLALPALTRAAKIQRRAARVGFDWSEMGPVLDKIEEEVAELREVINQGDDVSRMEHEIGDLIFACVNLARHAELDPEVAVRSVNRRFESRFRRVEELASQDGGLQAKSLEEMDALWERAKAEEN